MPSSNSKGARFSQMELRRTTARNTQETIGKQGGRATRNSQAAKLRHFQQMGLRGDFAAGSYGHGRQHGLRALNEGHGNAISGQVDHIPTDGSQRGKLKRSAAANQVDTVERPAAMVPTSLHRQHPSTSGGSSYDPLFAQMSRKLQLGYPHVGTRDDALARGRVEATLHHIAGYESLMARSKLSLKRKRTIAKNLIAVGNVPTRLRVDGRMVLVPMNEAGRQRVKDLVHSFVPL